MRNFEVERGEEDDIEWDRKEFKKDRKQATANDRSKYKKTDKAKYLNSLQQAQHKKLNKQEWLEGRVFSILPQGIWVDYQGKKISCLLKGLLKKDKTQSKNLVAVGDFVLFEKTAENEGMISHVKPRKTILSRADNLSRRKEQLIAVNIDQVIITASVVTPPLKYAIIDRYIIATKKGGMRPLIVINKIDLLDSSDYDSSLLLQEKLIYEEALRAYAVIGVPVISVSVKQNKGVNLLKEAMKNTSSVFSGQSGVGKSSLINAVTGLDLRVRETVDKTKKGAHTTTTTQLIALQEGGWCIDTPGIKSFGIWELQRDEIEGYFTEIHALGRACKFMDCTHSHEEQCAVQDALEEGKLSPLRYESYQSLRLSVGETHVRR